MPLGHSDHAGAFRVLQACFEDSWFEPVPGLRG
jgi:hypothetical protein